MGVYDRKRAIEIYKSYMDIVGVCDERKEPTKENIKWFLTNGHKEYRKMDGMLPLFYSALTIYNEHKESKEYTSL